jgi:hypothetical protein
VGIIGALGICCNAGKMGGMGKDGRNVRYGRYGRAEKAGGGGKTVGFEYAQFYGGICRE